MRNKRPLASTVLLVIALVVATPGSALSQAPVDDGRAYLARIVAMRLRTPTFTDNFDAGGKQWRIGSAPETLTGFADGTLVFQMGSALSATAALAPVDVTDFLAEVTAIHRSGGTDAGASLLFNVVNPENFHAFSVSAAGYYAISQVIDGRASHLTPPTASTAIQQGRGAVNRLTVMAKGETVVFLVNNRPLQTHTLDKAAGGAIGLGAALYGGEDAEVAFDDLRVWEMASGNAPPARTTPAGEDAPVGTPAPTAASEPTAPPEPTARPTAEAAPTATPTPRPEPTATPTPKPITLENLPIEWSALAEDFVISNVHLVENDTTSDGHAQSLVFDVTARRDLGIFIYMASFNDEEGELMDSAELEFQLAPEAMGLTDVMGGWNAGAYGTVRMQLPLRMTGMATIEFERFF